jgi:MFS family permease
MDAPSHPLQISDYRRFWAARFASVIATIGMVVIIGYQLYDLARSDYGMSIGEAAFQLGLLGLAQFVPLFLLTPVAGVVADRFDRRLVGALSMGIDLVVALTLALATSLDLLSLPLLFVMAAMHGAARVFVGPAIGAIAPNIVPAALLPKAVALNSMAMQGGMILGPALGGLLYARGASLPYWFAVALLAFGTATILTIRRLPPPEGNRKARPFAQALEGARFVWHERFLLGCMTLDLFAVPKARSATANQ